jgi:hypothetical protein
LFPQFETFLDAAPEKGVIVVEYWWQPPSRLNSGGRHRTASPAVGARASMVYFKRLLVGDKCWCGSRRAFGKCHRRADDWTYVSLDPDQAAYSPVVLLERSFGQVDAHATRRELAAHPELLWIEIESDRAQCVLSAQPPIVSEFGHLVIGSIEIRAHGMRIETNSDRRLDYLTRAMTELLGADMGPGETRRADPQKTFPAVPPPRARRPGSRVR